MEEKNLNRTRIVGLRLTQAEYDKIEKRWKATTCRKLSDYIRRCIFDKPVVTTYRNRSLDDFMSEMIRLRHELNALGYNFNQSVKKLHTLDKIAEFRLWLMRYEIEKAILFNKVDDIKNYLQKQSEIWLQ